MDWFLYDNDFCHERVKQQPLKIRSRGFDRAQY